MTVTDSPAPLPAGRYLAGSGYQVPLQYTLPAGWEGLMGGPYAIWLDRNQGPNLALVIFNLVYKDPCRADLGFVSPMVGPSGHDLATALARLPNTTASGITEVTVSGFPAIALTLTAPADLSSCTEYQGERWNGFQLPLGAVDSMTAGQAETLWIVDVPGGKRLTVFSVGFPALSGADKADVQAIVDSIVITP